MKLYYFPVAPNPTKVRTYLAEKGIQIDTELVNLAHGEQRSAAFLEKNPAGNLPVLELDDGSHLNESLAIIEYLEELHPEPPMIGTTPRERARVRSVERLADLGVLVPMAIAVHTTKSPLGLPPIPEVAQWARARYLHNLKLLDEQVGAGPFVCGERVTIADCTLWAALGFARFGGLELDPRFENLVRWRDRFGERPSAHLST